jgi:hypothetical protein
MKRTEAPVLGSGFGLLGLICVMAAMVMTS